MTGRRRVAVLAVAGLYLGTLGFLAGVLSERLRFDSRRGAVLAHLADVEARLHARLIEAEGRRADLGSAPRR